MVQRKVPNKLGIKTHLKSDTQLVNLRPSSPQTHEKLKKIMKKSRPIKRSDELRSLPPFRKKRTQPVHEDGAGLTSATPQKQSPNYMKSTSSFEARKESSRSPSVSSLKTLSPKALEKSKTNSLPSGHKGSRKSSIKVVRTLTKTPSFKPSRPSKKCSSVILCEDLDAQRATCSSTLKDSKFPNYLELSPGGTELEGSSTMKVCPYTYCSLSGHHHAPVPPLRCFLSARRRALKTQKSFKVGCLSPRQTKPVGKKNREIVRETVIFEAPEEVDMEAAPITPLMEEENNNFFIETYRKDEEGKDSQVMECSDINWEEGYGSGSVSCLDGVQTFESQARDGDVSEAQTWETGVERLYSVLQDLYDEESVSSGAWSEEDGDSESDSSYHRKEDRSFQNYDACEMSSTTIEEVNKKMDEDKITGINGCKKMDFEEKKDEFQGLNLPIDRNIKCIIDYHQEETSQKPENIPDFAEKSQDGKDKGQTTIIYNIIQFNISVFINGEKTEYSETDKGITVHDDKMEMKEVNEEHGMGNEDDDANNLTSDEEIPFHAQLNANEHEKKRNEYLEDDKHSESLGLQIDEEPASRTEITSETDISSNELPNPSINLRRSPNGKTPDQKMKDLKEFNPRGPNFLPEVSDPDEETVDLKHQTMDERKNAEEWMVDFALQQAVTTLAPARKRKVALLVEAFEKVSPIPKYETHNRHTSKAFTDAIPMQACS